MKSIFKTNRQVINTATKKKPIATKITSKPKTSSTISLAAILRLIMRIFAKILLGALLLTLAWNIYDFTRPSRAPIKKVKVVATFAHVERKLIETTIFPFLNNGFFYINVIRLKHQLQEIPWVHHALVAREWPDTLIVKIDEQVPIANWQKIALVNNDGKLFTPPSATFPLGLPVFYGVEDQLANIIDNYQKMTQILARLNFSISEIALDRQHLWHLTLNNRMEIFLGDDKSISRLERLVKLYPKIAARHSRPIQSIDLRYNNGIAVK